MLYALHDHGEVTIRLVQYLISYASFKQLNANCLNYIL